MSYNKKNVWLYSSNNDTWSLFDSESTEKLNKIYQDYVLRKKQPAVGKENFCLAACPKQSDKKITKLSSDHVTYDIDEKLQEHTSSNLQEEIELNKTPNYTIKIDGEYYYIDLDHMKQISCSDITRQKYISKQ